MGRIATIEEVVEANGGAQVSGIRFAEEGVLIDVEFADEAREGIRVAKSVAVEWDVAELGADAFDIFRRATELAFEARAAASRMPRP